MLDLSQVQSKEDALLLKSVFESAKILRSYPWFASTHLKRCRGGWSLEFVICESLSEEVEVTATDFEALMSVSPARVFMVSVLVKNQMIVMQVNISSHDEPVLYTSVQVDKIRKRQRCL